MYDTYGSTFALHVWYSITTGKDQMSNGTVSLQSIQVRVSFNVSSPNLCRAYTLSVSQMAVEACTDAQSHNEEI
jgi:hypothetical protein